MIDNNYLIRFSVYYRDLEERETILVNPNSSDYEILDKICIESSLSQYEIIDDGDSMVFTNSNNYEDFYKIYVDGFEEG